MSVSSKQLERRRLIKLVLFIELSLDAAEVIEISTSSTRMLVSSPSQQSMIASLDHYI